MRTSVPYPSGELYVVHLNSLHVASRHIGVKHVGSRPQHPDREEDDTEEEETERQEVSTFEGIAEYEAAFPEDVIVNGRLAGHGVSMFGKYLETCKT